MVDDTSGEIVMKFKYNSRNSNNNILSKFKLECNLFSLLQKQIHYNLSLMNKRVRIEIDGAKKGIVFQIKVKYNNIKQKRQSGSK